MSLPIRLLMIFANFAPIPPILIGHYLKIQGRRRKGEPRLIIKLLIK